MVLENYQNKVKCPRHGCLIGKYDSRIGIVNTTFYCQKCKKEYTFTIRAQKNKEKISKPIDK